MACLSCGNSMPKPARGRPPTTCSPACKNAIRAAKARESYGARCAVKFLPCAECGSLWTCRNSKPGLYCRDCRTSVASRQTREWLANYTAERGVSYGWDKYPEKRKAAAKWDESRKAAYQRRRAAKRGASAEKFTNAEAYERDNWTCGICDKSIDRELAYPDPMSVSLDHIVPLSLGGEHSLANTRASHLTCNVKRGNRAA